MKTYILTLFKDGHSVAGVCVDAGSPTAAIEKAFDDQAPPKYAGEFSVVVECENELKLQFECGF